MFGVTNMDKTLNKLDEMKFVVFLIFVSMLHHKLLFFEKKIGVILLTQQKMFS